MSKRNVRLFLEDILKAIEKVERYITGMSFGEFENNELVVDAVTRNLEVIGEAAKHIPPETRAGYDAVDWQKVAGFRDIAIHAYFDVDVEIVWTIASRQLGDLKHLVVQMLHDLENQTKT